MFLPSAENLRPPRRTEVASRAAGSPRLARPNGRVRRQGTIRKEAAESSARHSTRPKPARRGITAPGQPAIVYPPG
jgi:hypothetical protein